MFSLLWLCGILSVDSSPVPIGSNDLQMPLLFETMDHTSADWLLFKFGEKKYQGEAVSDFPAISDEVTMMKKGRYFDTRRSISSNGFHRHPAFRQMVPGLPVGFYQRHYVRKRNVSELSGRFCAFGKIKLSNGKCIPCVKYLDSADGSCDAEVFKTVCPIQWQVICV